MAYEIYTYDYGDMMQNILNAVAAIVSSDNYIGIVASAATIYLVYKMLQAVFGREGDLTSIMKNLIILVAVISALTQIKSTVIINDRVSPSKTGIVSNVPWAIAFPLWISSRLEYILTNTFETALSVPSEVSYNTVGFAGGLKNIRDASLYIQIADPYLRQSIVQFHKDCVFTAILDGFLNPAQVAKDKVVNVISAAGSLEPARPTVIYSSANPNGVTTTCEDASTEILNRINTDKVNAFSSLAQAMGYSETTLENLLGGEFAFYLGISDNAKDTVYQEALLTISKDALISKAAEAGIDPNQLGLTIATAKEKMFLSNVSAGEQVKELLPEIRAILVMLASLSTPIILAIGLAVGRPIKYAATAFAIFFFPVLWGMLDAFVNFYINSKFTELKGLVASTSYSSATINIVNYPLIHLKLKDSLAAAGWLATMIPVISVMLASGSAYAFVKVAGGITSSIVGSSSGAAASTATGNLSYGNASIGNRSYNNLSAENTSFNNFSANKWDSTVLFGKGIQISNSDIFSDRKIREFTNKAIVDTQNVVKAGNVLNFDGTNIVPTLNRNLASNNTQQTSKDYSTLKNAGNVERDGVLTDWGIRFSLLDRAGKGTTGGKVQSYADNTNITSNANIVKEAGKQNKLDNSVESSKGINTTEVQQEGKQHTTQSAIDIPLGANLNAKFPRLTSGSRTPVVSLTPSVSPKGRKSPWMEPLSLITPNQHIEMNVLGRDYSVKSEGYNKQNQITQNLNKRETSGQTENAGRRASISNSGSKGESYSENVAYREDFQSSKQGDISRTTGISSVGETSYFKQNTANIGQRASEGNNYIDGIGVNVSVPLSFFTPEGRRELTKALEYPKQFDPQAYKMLSRNLYLTEKVLQGNLKETPIPEDLIPRSPDDFTEIKEKAEKAYENYSSEVNPHKVDGDTINDVNHLHKKADGELEKLREEVLTNGESVRRKQEGTREKAEEEVRKTEGDIRNKGENLEEQYSKAFKDVQSKIEEAKNMSDSPSVKKAFEALKKNDAFKALLITAGISKAGELLQWAAENPEAVKGFLQATGRSAQTVARVLARNPETAVLLALGALAYKLSEKMKENGAITASAYIKEVHKHGGTLTTGGMQYYQNLPEISKEAFEYAKKLFGSPPQGKWVVKDNKIIFVEDSKVKELFESAEKVH